MVRGEKVVYCSEYINILLNRALGAIVPYEALSANQSLDDKKARWIH